MQDVIFDKDAERQWGDAPQAEGEGNPPEPTGTRKAVGVVVVKDGKYLVGTRISNTGYGQLCGPGGHVEPGEDVAHAAIRETEEEFGIIPNDLYFLDRKDPTSETGLENYLFLCTDYEGEPKCDNEEMTDAHFISDEDADLLRDMAFPAFIDGIDRMKKEFADPSEEPEPEYPNTRDKQDWNLEKMADDYLPERAEVTLPERQKKTIAAFRSGVDTRL